MIVAQLEGWRGTARSNRRHLLNACQQQRAWAMWYTTLTLTTNLTSTPNNDTSMQQRLSLNHAAYFETVRT